LCIVDCAIRLSSAQEWRANGGWSFPNQTDE
jgi:hypothetical protein